MTSNPSVPERSIPGVDASQLQEITGGEPDIMADIVEEFAETSGELVATIAAALPGNDARAILRAAHTLKGSSGIIGAESLRATSLAIERAAAEGDAVTAASLVPGLRELHTATIAALRGLVVAARSA